MKARCFAKPLYGLTPVPRVRIPPSPPDVLSPVSIVVYLTAVLLLIDESLSLAPERCILAYWLEDMMKNPTLKDAGFVASAQ
jgi:hypothetical protein